MSAFRPLINLNTASPDTPPKGLPATVAGRTVSLMARLASTITHRRQRLFLTPAESAQAAQAQFDQINQGLAVQRQQLRDAILRRSQCNGTLATLRISSSCWMILLVLTWAESL